MTQISYREIAEQTIRSFLKAVVLIDDHWSEAQGAPIIESLDPVQINTEPLTVPLQEDVDEDIIADDIRSPSSLTSTGDPAYLREIGTEITKQGFLFTGFQYKDDLKETAFELASKSDILILDWYLGNADPRPALALLKRLGTTGSPRFVFILTDQDLAEVRNRIIEQLGKPTKGTKLVFSCGTFSFSLKNKPQTGGPNTVDPANVLNEAINGIREQFGGLLQLAALQLLSSYKGKLHEVLAHFSSKLDAPFIAEWLENSGPIGPNSCFKGLMIDEWRSLVEKDQPSATSMLSEEGISAFIASKKDIPQWGGKSAEAVLKRIEHKKQRQLFPNLWR